MSPRPPALFLAEHQILDKDGWGAMYAEKMKAAMTVESYDQCVVLYLNTFLAS
jgi:hypothetical protein